LLNFINKYPMIFHSDILNSLQNMIVAVYEDIYEGHPHIAIYRTASVEVAVFLKLSSYFTCNMAVDAFTIDTVENLYRFTVVYNLQSIAQNYSIRLVLKTTDSLAVLSLQSIYPAFN
jgi:NADH:ubiquinone oxidoreductase subunit C